LNFNIETKRKILIINPNKTLKKTVNGIGFLPKKIRNTRKLREAINKKTAIIDKTTRLILENF
jgi:hypothetical protein